MNRREKARVAAMLWTALEEMEHLEEAATTNIVYGKGVKVVVGEFDANGDGTHEAGILVDLETGRAILAAVDRIIRERMFALGELDVSEVKR